VTERTDREIAGKVEHSVFGTYPYMAAVRLSSGINRKVWL